MKLNVLITFFVIISVFINSGCNARYDNLYNELEKMQTIINNNDIFNNDYSFSINTVGYGEDRNLTIIKDGDNYYLKLIEHEKIIEGWVFKENNIYLAYINHEDKFYMNLNTGDDYIALSKVMEMFGIADINFYLKDIYTSTKINITNLLESCENSKDNICKIERELFSKFIFNMEYKISNESNVSIVCNIKKGKLMYMKYQLEKNDITSKTEWNFNYNNQNIKLENKNEFQLMNN